MMYGAYATTRRLAVSRIFLRFVWFSLASVFVTLLYVKALQKESIGIYAGVQFFISFLMRIPACHLLTNQCDRWPLIRFVKWMRQERHYIGRGMYESSLDFIKYMLFWLVILSGKFSFAYFLQIKPLVDPTRDIIEFNNIVYSWHDFVSKKPPQEIHGITSFHEIKEGSNYNTMCMERKSCRRELQKLKMVEMEEAKAKENEKLQSSLQEMQLQFKETKLLLEKERETTKIMVERVPVIQEVPVVDHALLDKLSSENEKLKNLVSSLEKKIDETKKRYEEANKISEERLKQALDAE